MSKKSLVDSVEIKTPCAEDWNAMKGDETVRFCGHCSLNVNNISMMTRKQALKLVRESNGRLCIRYVKNPVSNQPIFADKLYQISRRAPRIAAATMATALSLSSITYAQNEPQEKPQPEIMRIHQLTYFDPVDKDEEKEIKSESGTASISGVVTDPRGAVIPNISVTLTNTETTQTQTLTSNEEGFYEFQNVAAGNYTLKAEGMNGFKATQIGLSLSDGENSKQDIAMQVADIESITLEVSGASFITLGVIAVAEYVNPLHRAVSKDDAEEVKNLITNGANVNSKDEIYGKSTPLFLAVENGNAEIAEILLNFGAKINVRDENRQTPLMRLDADASAELVNLLIRHGAKINAADEEKNTPLIFAAGNGKPEVLKILLENGARINQQNEDGETALMIAAAADNLENVRFLLETGADVNLKDAEGDAAIDYANGEETEKLLISYGAKTKKSSEETEPEN